MGRWTDIAIWRGPTGNQGGRMSAHRGVVLHVAEGTFEGTISWCLNESSGVSAHFVVARDGRIAQLVDTDIQAWCQAAGNPEWLSIENEGYGGQELTAAQAAACARVVAKAHCVYGVPLEPTSSPGGCGLGHHSMGGIAWGGHSLCPGSPIIAQKQEILRLAAEEPGVTGVSNEEDSDVKTLMRYRKSQEDQSPHVFLTDGLFARWVTSEGEIADLRTLWKEGSIKLGFNGDIRLVGRRELVGRIIGRVPSGWEDMAA